MDTEEQNQVESSEEEPQVYAVKKETDGWRFDRRAFLTVAGTAAAAAAAASLAGCDLGGEQVAVVQTVVVTNTPEPPSAASATASPESTVTLAPTSTLAPTDTAAPADTSTPTSTPTHTPTPTPAAPRAQFIKDVTIPDGTVMKPNTPFTKTWRFKNVGSVGWGEGVRLVFVAGEQKGFPSKQMQAVDAVAVPDVAPGQTVDVSVDLVSPEQMGQHRSYWRLQLRDGEWLENIHYADIFVAVQKPVEEAFKPGEEGISYKVKVGEQWVTWTQPCGSPIPPGAVCICNCVAVPTCSCVGHCSCDTVCSCVGHCGCDQVCSCDEVCTCDTICSCVGHHYWYPN